MRGAGLEEDGGHAQHLLLRHLPINVLGWLPRNSWGCRSMSSISPRASVDIAEFGELRSNFDNEIPPSVCRSKLCRSSPELGPRWAQIGPNLGRRRPKRAKPSPEPEVAAVGPRSARFGQIDCDHAFVAIPLALRRFGRSLESGAGVAELARPARALAIHEISSSASTGARSTKPGASLSLQRPSSGRRLDASASDVCIASVIRAPNRADLFRDTHRSSPTTPRSISLSLVIEGQIGCPRTGSLLQGRPEVSATLASSPDDGDVRRMVPAWHVLPCGGGRCILRDRLSDGLRVRLMGFCPYLPVLRRAEHGASREDLVDVARRRADPSLTTFLTVPSFAFSSPPSRSDPQRGPLRLRPSESATSSRCHQFPAKPGVERRGAAWSGRSHVRTT